VLGPDQFRLTWNSVAGRNYQVQSKDSVSASTWITNASVTATGFSTSFTNAGMSSVGQRFYRVVNTL
jgi:hypothetical protein